ncbi:hypothetical protein [Bacteroides reticulotermitis]|uniref:portal protein n=1 Tax=Bacteroides reticulotermitis TaxID=1133319 RepID=UPI003A88CA2B
MKANLKMSAKLFPKQKRDKIDTVQSRTSFDRNENVLMDAFLAWTGLDSFRRMCDRNEMYTFADQWNDKVLDPRTCKYITERQHILNQGNIPLQNNRLRGIVRSVSGVFQSTQTEPVCVSRDRDKQSKGEMMSATIQYVYQLNKLWGLDAACFTNFLVTGIGMFRSTFGWRKGKMDVWTDLINHKRIFFDNHMEDPRHWDCHLIGEIHDVGLYDVMAQFADGSPEKAEEIRRIYSSCDRDRTIARVENLVKDARRFQNFFIPDDETRCRVIEIWKQESKERLLVHDKLTGEFYKAEVEEQRHLNSENEKRMAEQAAQGIESENMKLIDFQWFIDNYWYYYFMSPQGDILKEGETPFWHESHPYSFKIYPFFNSKVYPFVGDFIDQQRYINRLITLQDFVTRSTAKGVLAIHQDSIPDGMTAKDFADEWAVFNGVIVYKGKTGVPMPQQIVSNSAQLGLTDMLSIQLKLLEDISGVQGALQGQAPKSGTPASLYMQQTQNSTTSLTELFEAFRELREERDNKNLKLIQQYYTEPRYININGNNARPETMLYEPNTVRNSEFDLSITESTSTPAYRLVMNDFLMQLFSAQQITLEELLQNGAFPFSDKLLQAINSRKQEAEAAQEAMMNGGQTPSMQQQLVPEDIQQQITQNTNPLVQQMLAGNNVA